MILYLKKKKPLQALGDTPLQDRAPSTHYSPRSRPSRHNFPIRQGQCFVQLQRIHAPNGCYQHSNCNCILICSVLEVLAGSLHILPHLNLLL